MSSFKDFWRELKNLPVELKPGVAISPSLVYSLKNNIVTATIAPVSIGLALARSNSNQEEAEEFSKQVADIPLAMK